MGFAGSSGGRSVAPKHLQRDVTGELRCDMSINLQRTVRPGISQNILVSVDGVVKALSGRRKVERITQQRRGRVSPFVVGIASKDVSP